MTVRRRATSGSVESIGPDDPVDRLHGIGPRLRSALADEGVNRVLDLLLHLPLRYEDRSTTVGLRRVRDADGPVLVRAEVIRVRSRYGRRRRTHVTEAVARDASGTLPVVWFNQPWLPARLDGARELYLFGEVRPGRGGALQLVSPEIDEAEPGAVEPGVVPVYPRLGPLSGRRLRRLVGEALACVPEVPEPLPEVLRRDLGVPSLAEALETIHRPPVPEGGSTPDWLETLNQRRSASHRRLALDELVAFCCVVESARIARGSREAPSCGVEGGGARLAADLLPFTLTSAQLRVTTEILGDMAARRPMARLLQGDVGAGKTAVAALAMRAAAESGRQAALLAPTELLAEQHHRTLAEMFLRIGVDVALLTSSRAADERRAVLDGLSTGDVGLVVGTHALLQEGVLFDDLALAVIDEQHRFGVEQRQALLEKGPAPHLLVMTATPIPRTLALTLYGDLDVSILDELPPGRRRVRTVLRPPRSTQRLYEFLEREIEDGGRVFMVFPLIDPSDEIEAEAVTRSLERVRRRLPEAVVGVLHGRLDPSERERVSEAFRGGSIQVLLATTMVEVGVDVPEASVMVISSPERFGLSQLHQLRGRVGRGRRASWCVLLADPEALPAPARRRLEVFCRTDDGFAIAEADLELRGAGEITGTRQWGPGGFRFADLGRHADLVATARRVCAQLATEGRLQEVARRLSHLHPRADRMLVG